MWISGILWNLRSLCPHEIGQTLLGIKKKKKRSKLLIHLMELGGDGEGEDFTFRRLSIEADIGVRYEMGREELWIVCQLFRYFISVKQWYTWCNFSVLLFKCRYGHSLILWKHFSCNNLVYFKIQSTWKKIGKKIALKICYVAKIHNRIVLSDIFLIGFGFYFLFRPSDKLKRLTG